MMFGFQVRNRQNVAASPRAPTDPTTAVGEIDTAPPFESVKAAVNLFVEASPKVDRPVVKKSRAFEESVLGKETQLHWILKEINKYKEHVKTAESTKEKALGDLEKANKTLQELTRRLEAVGESKQTSTEATEVAKTRAERLEQLKSTKDQLGDEEWQEAVGNETKQYKAAANQLISAKQQLNNLKQDFDIAMEAKLASVQRAAEAHQSAELNRKKINDLSKDVDHMSVTLERLKLASVRAEEDHARLMEEKEAVLESKNKVKEDIDSRILCLRKEADDPGNLEKGLEETTEAANMLQEQLEEVCAADTELLRNSNSEIDEARRRLEEMKEEEASLRDVVESLKQELEDVRRDISVSKEEELKVEQLQAEVDQIKMKLQEAITEKAKVTNEVKELELKIREMTLETEKARHEEDETRREVEQLWREAEWSELAIKEAEEKLEIAQREVEEAKAAQEVANDRIRKRSCCERTELIDSDSKDTIMLTNKDFEALSKKAGEARAEADSKVASIMAQVETIKQKERGILEKLEKSMEENTGIEEEISKAQKAAEVADEARQTVETELSKWRQQTNG